MGAVKGDVHKCSICGKSVMVLEVGDGGLICCGENMKRLSSEEEKVIVHRVLKSGSL